MTTKLKPMGKYRGVTWQRWTLRGLLVLAILGLVTLVVLNAWADRKMASAIASADARGVSMDPKEYLSVLGRDEPNASHALGAVCHLMASVSPDPEAARWRELSFEDAVNDQTVIEQARIWLEQPVHRLVLEILDLHATTRRAGAVPWAEEELALAASGRFVNERGIPAMNLRALMRARMLTEVAAGNVDAAYADAASLLRMANWLHTDFPSVVSWMIGNAMATSGLRAVEELLRIDRPSSEARALVRAELQLLEERGVSLGLEADMAMSHQQILRGTLWSESDSPSSFRKWVSGVVQSPTETAYHATWLEGYIELIRWARMPPYERPAFEPWLPGDSPLMIPVKMLIPNLLDSLDKTDVVRMRYRLAFLALAWEDYRYRHGVYPEAPEDLVPDFLNALPEDAFTGGPLLWRREGNGWLVYSVGVNQEDEAGVDRGTPRSGDEDDIRWRLTGG